MDNNNDMENINNNICKSVFRIIPKGQKYILWFKKNEYGESILLCFHKKNISFYENHHKQQIINNNQKYNHNNNNNQRNIYISSYDPKLSYYHGTKCIGTFIHIKGKPFFFMEDIFLFQSHDVSKRSWYNKYILFFEIMNMYRPLNIINNIQIGLPITLSSYEKCITKCNTLSLYDIYSIEELMLYNHHKKQIHYRNKQKYEIYTISAEIQSDIYHVRDEKDNIIHNIKICIPDLNTSIFMNSYFRNIRENNNIDYIEESEDDEDFENFSDDKYIYKNKRLKCKCIYQHVFKAWKPIEIIS